MIAHVGDRFVLNTTMIFPGDEARVECAAPAPAPSEVDR
jgi:hypothetical protein